jgi:hypothetical protein
MADIKVAEFCKRLTNRNKLQGDGEHTAEDFRKRYMSKCLNEDFWKGCNTIIFDFSDVIKIGPSFANEAFAFFMGKFNVDKKTFNEHIKFKNISRVQELIIQQELDSGYSK